MIDISGENVVLVGALLLFVAVMAGKVAYRFGAPALLLFLGVGMLFGLNFISFRSVEMTQFVGMIALCIILFTGGMDTSFQEIKPIIGPGVVLATVGVVMTAMVLAGFVWLVAPWLDLEISFALALLLAALARLAQFYPGGFSVEAFTVDMGTPGMDLSPLADYCRELGVPVHRIPPQMYHVLFETRREQNPCALCAKMRRGSLHTALLEAGIHKVALGHHYDDAVETFFLSLFYESRLSCFHPVTYLDRTDITQIRPLLYVSEAMIREAVPRLQLPVVHNPCPADGHTKRQVVKTLIASLEPQYPKLKESVFAAMQRLPLPHWAPRELRRRPPTE